MDPRLLLMLVALRSRKEADELLLASRASRQNAEVLEVIVCEGSDDDVLEALKLVPK